MNLDDRHSILRRNYSGLDTRKIPSIQIRLRSLRGIQKLTDGFPLLLRLLSFSTGFSPPEGAVVDHHLLSGRAILSRVNDVIRALPSAPHPSLPVGTRLSNFVEAWSSITQDSWALSILGKGYRIIFVREPPLSSSPILFPVAQQHLSHLREKVQILLEKKAVEIMRDTTSPSFYSQIFLVKKKTGRFRLIIDLSSLNQMMRIEHFQMETTASIRRSIPPGT